MVDPPRKGFHDMNALRWCTAVLLLLSAAFLALRELEPPREGIALVSESRSALPDSLGTDDPQRERHGKR